MSIKIGDSLPEANLKTMADDGPADVWVHEYFASAKVVLFAVPGAFTPTCHLQHLPGFLETYEQFKARGVDKIACISVNDIFVLDAWAKSTGAYGKIDFLADGSAEFTRAIGMELDALGAGLGIRSQRYAMLVQAGQVVQLNVEQNPGVADISAAATLLAQLA